MVYFILLSIYVSSMASYGTTMIYIWFQHFIVDPDVPHNQVMLTSDEASDYYRTFKIISFIASTLLLPLFGHIADKFPTGAEIMFVYGLRSTSIMSFTHLNSPYGWFPMFTICVLKISTSL